MSRPKYPKTDGNHTMVIEVLRKMGYRYQGLDIFAIDTSSFGGSLTDYLLIAGGRVHFVEVKVPSERDNLTPKEAHTKSLGVPFYVVTTPEEVIDMLMDIVDEVNDG